MRYKLTQYAVTKRKQQKRQTEQQRLLAEIKDALRYKRYISATTEQERNFAPHQLEAAMEAITPVVERYVVQAKKRIW